MEVKQTSKELPEEEEEVLYWFAPFTKWYIGKFDGGWHFYNRNGFCDGHDAPYWIKMTELPDPREINFNKD